MKNIFLFALVLIACVAVSFKGKHIEKKAPKTIHKFKVPSIEGGTIDFSKYKGKKILVVNTASKCGFTPQYEGLEKLYKEHKDELVIIGFPANTLADRNPAPTKRSRNFVK